ncbi:MAG: hypothetical protein K5705_09570 [Oscillospiraceae bacterium]|nr:hypothetical protein [Oscillospiraceae bacterium]
MKNLNCRNCGGTMVIDPSGTTARCPYCKSDYVLDHRDTDYYREFYARMKSFFRLSADEQERRRRADELWAQAEQEMFECSDGRQINVTSLHRFTDRVMTAYTARQSVIFRFEESLAENADKFRKAVSMLDYPSADTRNLANFFPIISGGFTLRDGSVLLAVKKSEDEYPLRLFGTLSGRHTAWLVGRMENLCCVMEYSSIVHPDFGIDTIYIDPYDHQASLYGGWWNAVRNHTTVSGRVLTTRDNLKALRETAAQVLGFPSAAAAKEMADIPKPFADFLKSEPESNAYDDFAKWDEVLIKSYGERKFITMDTDDAQIYGKGT